MPRLTAAATLPLNDSKLATSALRGRLGLMVEEHGGEVDWATLQVVGPRLHVDALGRQWFEWAAAVDVDAPADGSPAAEEPEPRLTVADLGILRRKAG